MSTSGQSHVQVPTFGGYSTPRGLVGVPFAPRFAARAIDTLVHIVIVFGAAFVFTLGIVIYATFAGKPWEPVVESLGTSGLIGFFLGLLGALSYQTICEGVGGASLGKRILGLAVVKEDGSFCTMRSALIRSAAYYIDALALGIVAYIAISGSPLGQRHGDRWGQTLVVRRKTLSADRLRGAGRFVLALFLGILTDAVAVLLSLVLQLV